MASIDPGMVERLPVPCHLVRHLKESVSLDRARRCVQCNALAFARTVPVVLNTQGTSKDGSRMGASEKLKERYGSVRDSAVAGVSDVYPDKEVAATDGSYRDMLDREDAAICNQGRRSSCRLTRIEYESHKGVQAYEILLIQNRSCVILDSYNYVMRSCN